jgi:tRNA A-37 threonylcarbamoyl transferase component Bud32
MSQSVIPSAAAPTVLAGRYRIEQRLGRGSSATVYAATDLRFDRQVILKIFDSAIAEDPKLRERFHQQAAKASRLRHANIGAILDAGYARDQDGGGTIFVVSEPTGSTTLRDLLKKRDRLSPTRAIKLTRQVAAALMYAHRQGVIHADVKPENVLVDEQGRRAWLTDFSLSFVAARTGVVTRETLARRAAYLAPEQVRGESVDRRTDVYGLGAMLYEMVVGRPPFVGDTPLETAERRVYEHARPVGLFDPSVPTGLETVIGRALEREPDKRWTSVEDLDAELAALRPDQLQSAQMPDLPEEAIGDHGRARRPRRAWGLVSLTVPILAAGLVLGLVLAFVVPFLRSGFRFENPLAGTEVPSVVGMSTDQARQYALAQGLQLTVVGDRVTERTPKGQIVQQAPIPGRRIDPREPIRVTESAGVLVPDVRGMSIDNATNMLKRLDWQVARIERGSYPGHPAGTVVLQHPAPQEQSQTPGELLLVVAE